MPDLKADAIAKLSEHIATAFRQAKAKGKPDWDRMRLAVLKNRLLALTEHTFNEKHYGANSMRELVVLVPETLQFVDPDHVRFLGPSASEPGPVPTRIRDDLWSAVVDYTSGKRYVWDPAHNEARSSTANDTRYRLPTLTREDVAAWRAEFVASQPGDPVLTKWRDADDHSTKTLARHHRVMWKKFFREKVKARIESWFAEQQLALPRLEAAPVPEREPESADALRRFAHACIDSMTERELEELRFPARAAMRARLGDRIR